MRLNLKNIIPSYILTLLLLILLELLSTAVLPAIGLGRYRIPFNVMIILYMAFKLELPIIALLIMGISYLHSFFSVEGWAIGTCAGIVVCLLISYLRDLVHLTSVLFTMLMTQVFQLVWFLVTAIFIYLKVGTMDYVLDRFFRYLPESIFISLTAPIFFALLDKIWRVRASGPFSEGR